MIYCPNLSDPQVKAEFEELIEVVGENQAYRIWSQNNGNPIDKAPNGKYSKLFKDLLELSDGDRNAAISLKAKVYSPEFTGWFGNWMKNEKPEGIKVKPGVSELFESNPELSKIGTQEQYSQYLDTIFPDSKVKDIVWRNDESEKNVLDTKSPNKAGQYRGRFFGTYEEVQYHGGQTRTMFPVLLNVIKPYNTDSSKKLDYFYTEDINKIKQTNDGIVSVKYDTKQPYEYVVFEPEQIHILSSKADIEGFKSFINSKSYGASKVVDSNGEPLVETISNEGEFSENNDNIYYQLDENRVDYELRLVNAIRDLTRSIFTQDKIQGWINDISKKGIPKEQIELFKSIVKDGMTKDEIITALLANYSYTVEINTATIKEGSPHARNENEYPEFEYNGNYFARQGGYFIKATSSTFDDSEIIFTDEYFEALEKSGITATPSKYYSNLTVPGGTNYTENEISTPLITPSIKGHAQFATDKGIGWERGADTDGKTKYTDLNGNIYVIKNGHIVYEFQSDLFQKGRDKKDLISGKELQDNYNAQYNDNIETFYDADNNRYFKVEDGKETTITEKEFNSINSPKESSKNQFLQLLNKDNNWVTFFIKSIVQNAAKKGYEKVLFPKGETAAKVEGHTTLENEILSKNRQIKELTDEININSIDDIKDKSFLFLDNKGETIEIKHLSSGKWEMQYMSGDKAFNVVEPTNEQIIRGYKRKNNEKLAQLEQQKSDLKSQGIEKLKPIEGFYEIRVGKILEKLYGKENVKTITDEYGNQWREININPERDTKTFYHQLNSNYENVILRENELLPADPKLHEKLEAFLNSAGFSLKILENIDADYVAKTDMIRKIIEVVEGKANMSTLPEEAGHIFVEMMADDNPLLVKMMKDVESFEGYQEIYDKYEKKYRKIVNGQNVVDEIKIKKEAIGKLIANEIIKEYGGLSADNKSKLLNWLERVLKWLKTKFKSGALDRFDAEVSPYREAAKMILNNEIPSNISIVNLEKRNVFIKENVYYQLDDDVELNQEQIIENISKALVKKTKDGYVRLDGTKVEKRVTDYVKSYYRRLFGDETPSEYSEALKMKGSYIHKIMENIMNEIIAIDANQDKPITEIINEVRIKLNKSNEIIKKSAEELISENPDFVGMEATDKFFTLGRQNKNGNINENKDYFNQLVDLALAKYRNIKEKQDNLNKFSDKKNGKFRIFTELIVYNQQEDTAGTIDLAVVYSNGSVGIYDWKGVGFETGDKGQVIEEGIKQYKERAWEIQIQQYKRILNEQYGVKQFAETRMIPINIQLDFNNPMIGFYNIEAGNKQGKRTYLNDVPVDKELISDEVEGSQYLNRTLQRLFSQKDRLLQQLEVSKGNAKVQAKLDRINKIIKGIQLRKEFQIIVDEMQSLINEYGNREHHQDKNNKVSLEEATQYIEYATMFEEVLSDLIAAVENDEVLKTNASVVRSNLTNFIQRLRFKIRDLQLEFTSIDLDQASVEESYMGRNFKSLYNMNNAAFKVLRTIIGQNHNNVRVKFNTIEKEVSNKTNALKEWAKNKGMSLQDVYDKIIVNSNGTLKLASKYNSLFREEKANAIKNKDAKWFENNTLVERKDGKLYYTGKAKERFEKIKADKFKNLEMLYTGEDQSKKLQSEKDKWLKRYDITENSDALFNEKNYFLYMKEQDKYMSEFWNEATQPGNEALREYYEMYVGLNEEFADLTDQKIDNRFIANVSKDIIDSIGENGITGLGRLGGMISKSIEVRQYDSVRGSVLNGEQIKSIPLLFLDELTESVSKAEIEEIKTKVKNIKNEKGEQKFTGVDFEGKVQSEIAKLAKEKGNPLKSRDLSKSLLLFANSALTYSALKESEAAAQSALYYVKSGGGYHHQTDKFGNRKKDEFDNMIDSIPGIPKKEVELLEKFIDAVWYGQKTQGKDKIIKVGDKEYSGTKIAQKTMQYVSLKALGLNVFVAAGNLVNTYSNVMMSGVEGNIFKGAIRKSMNLLKSDKQKFLAAGALFETFAHDEKYEKANKISSSSLGKILTMDNMYWMMKKPDQWADHMVLIGMMHSYGIENGKLVKLQEENSPNAIINLLKHDKESDSWGVEGMSDEAFAAFRQAVFHMSYKLKGTRSEGNLSATDLTLASQALMQFRNWMPGVIDNRFGKLKYDDILLDFNQGRFAAFGNEMRGTVADKAQALYRLTKEMFFIKSFSAKDKKMNLQAAEYYLTKFISENPQYKGKLSLDQFLKMREGKIRGLATELRIVLALQLLVLGMGALLFSGGDDDDDDRISQFIKRNAYRVTNRGLLELSFFFDPAATFRSFYISPVAIFKPIKDLGKVWGNTMDEFRDEVYGENSPNDKTDWMYYGQDYVVGWNQAVDFFDLFGVWRVENEP